MTAVQQKLETVKAGLRTQLVATIEAKEPHKAAQTQVGMPKYL